jgi:hypothetical protein
MDRRRVTGSTVDTSRSSIATTPEVGSTIRLTIRSRVVLPEPDDPTSATVR